MDKKPISQWSVGELIDSPEFRHELSEQISMEIGHHDKMKAEAIKVGMRLQRAPIQRLRERGLLDVENVIACYKLILNKQLSPSYFSAAEREYIKLLCNVASWRTIAKVQQREKAEAEAEKGGDGYAS